MTKRFILAALLLLGVIFIVTAVFANLSAGTKAPDFTLQTLDGKKFTLADNFKAPGKVVLLDIWATWCPPCRAEIPHLVKLQNKYKDKAVVFVGVAVDDKKADVASFSKKNKINYTVCADEKGKTISSKYQVRGIPATYIIDKKGVIRYVHSGFGGADDAAKMDKEIASLLK
ncbi:MAG: TlpA family protein disulfide reductase [Armatimonadetes bacterium]|nr:TlpA family protein disulfide reductase [Armatimonadota bacterium]